MSNSDDVGSKPGERGRQRRSNLKKNELIWLRMKAPSKGFCLELQTNDDLARKWNILMEATRINLV